MHSLEYASMNETNKPFNGVAYFYFLDLSRALQFCLNSKRHKWRTFLCIYRRIGFDSQFTHLQQVFCLAFFSFFNFLFFYSLDLLTLLLNVTKTHKRKKKSIKLFNFVTLATRKLFAHLRWIIWLLHLCIRKTNDFVYCFLNVNRF